jgi:hypothetical protein
MSKFTLEIDYEVADKLVTSCLLDSLDNLIKDYNQVVEKKKGFVFHNDWEKDKDELEKLIEAIKLTLKYYGVE